MSKPAFVAHSRCECQASLRAELDGSRHVVQGTAFLRGQRELAPAHAIGAEADRFDIGWLCPFCTRNVLRSFSAGSLQAWSPRAASGA
jgi:hypothetical protein